MIDTFWALFEIDRYTFMMVCSLVAVVCWLMSLMLGSKGLATLFAPVLFMGALAANYAFRIGAIVPTGDKDTNTAIASAAGVFGALLVLLFLFWLSTLSSERKTRRMLDAGTQVIPPAPGDIRRRQA